MPIIDLIENTMYGLGGNEGPKFDTFYPQTEPSTGTGPAGTDTPTIDTIHEVSLFSRGPNRTGLSLSGMPGPKFDIFYPQMEPTTGTGPAGTDDPVYDTFGEISLINENGTNLGLQGQPGPQFDNFYPGTEPPQDPNNPTLDTLHELYLTSNLSPQLHLGGVQGSPFDFGPEPNTTDPNLIDSFHEASLSGLNPTVVLQGTSKPIPSLGYTYHHGGTSGFAPHTQLGLGGNEGPKFDTFYPGVEPGTSGPGGNENFIVDTIHEDLLTRPLRDPNNNMDFDGKKPRIFTDKNSRDIANRRSLNQVPIDSLTYADVNDNNRTSTGVPDGALIPEEKLFTKRNGIGIRGPAYGQGFTIDDKDLHVYLLENRVGSNHLLTTAPYHESNTGGKYDLNGQTPDSYIDKMSTFALGLDNLNTIG
tara:strand:+ start:3943 stop:5193 length:1251 start_codon:yes stop_codon:yes gene_type:complete